MTPMVNQKDWRLRLNNLWEPDELTGCMWWTGHIGAGGYGTLWADGKNRKAHRLAYELWVGPVPDGLELDHLCRNRSCICPAHLEAVDHRTNVVRGIGPTSSNASKTHCVNGHPLSGENLRITYVGTRMCKACHRRVCERGLRRRGKDITCRCEQCGVMFRPGKSGVLPRFCGEACYHRARRARRFG